MNPLLHWGNSGIIKGFHSLDPQGGLGSEGLAVLGQNLTQTRPRLLDNLIHHLMQSWIAVGGLGFKVLELRVLGFGVLGFRVLGFRVYGARAGGC